MNRKPTENNKRKPSGRADTITLGAVLDRVQEVEDRRAKYYADVRDQSGDNGVRLLAYYLARHRRHQEQALGEFKAPDINKARRIKMPLDAPLFPEDGAALFQTSPRTVGGRDLLKAAITYNTQLVRLYASLLMVPQGLGATSLILALIRIEAGDTEMLNRMSVLEYF